MIAGHANAATSRSRLAKVLVSGSCSGHGGTGALCMWRITMLYSGPGILKGHFLEAVTQTTYHTHVVVSSVSEVQS